MTEYTKEIHAQRVRAMLQARGPNGCPAGEPDFTPHGDCRKHWSNDPCSVCLGFIGLEDYDQPHSPFCPCEILGTEEAVRRTWERLKEERDAV